MKYLYTYAEYLHYTFTYKIEYIKYLKTYNYCRSVFTGLFSTVSESYSVLNETKTAARNVFSYNVMTEKV